MDPQIIQNVKFDERGLIPAIVQDSATREVVALYHMDNDSLLRTLHTGKPSFCAAPAVGGLSGVQITCKLVDLRINTDGESLTVVIDRESAGTPGEKPTSLLSEFREAMATNPSEVSLVDVSSMEFGLAINALYSLIAERKEKRPEGSYTSYLFNSGLDKILKKIAEEAGEVIIASKNRSSQEIVSELADLFYHLLVLMVERDVKLTEVHAELVRRANVPTREGTLEQLRNDSGRDQ